MMMFNYLDYSKNIEYHYDLLTDYYIQSSFVSLQLLMDKAFMELQGINTSAVQVATMIALEIH
jgi:hypothetical protein